MLLVRLGHSASLKNFKLFNFDSKFSLREPAENRSILLKNLVLNEVDLFFAGFLEPSHSETKSNHSNFFRARTWA